jgi:2-oxoisovalerate dehydrogenase E1 component
MLWTALQDPDPVLIFENVMLYNRPGRSTRRRARSTSRAAIRREGTDVSLITYGGSLWKTLEAAEALGKEGIRPRSSTCARCGRSTTRRSWPRSPRPAGAVIVDEGWRSGSLRRDHRPDHEQAFWSLDAPLGRVCAVEVPIPYPKHLEDASIPQVPTSSPPPAPQMGR